MDVAGPDRLSVLQHFSKEELAYRELRAAILANVLKPGERLIPQQLASRFNVSTMPVRQALMRLEADRLVLRLPNRGLLVSPLSIKEVESIYTLRVVLEGLAAGLATPHLSAQDLDALAAMVDEMERLVSERSIEALVEQNTKFHFTIYRAAGNDHLYDILQHLWDLSTRYRNMYYHEPGIPESTLREHRGIMDALRQRDAAKVEELVRSDMEETARVLLALVRGKIDDGGSVNGKLPLG